MNRIFRTITAAVLLVFMVVGMTSCCKPKPKINQEELELKVGDTKSLYCGLDDGSISVDSQNLLDVDWDSNDSEIATVEKSGKCGHVTAISPGKCKITATYKGKSDFCKVTVTE